MLKCLIKSYDTMIETVTDTNGISTNKFMIRIQWLKSLPSFCLSTILPSPGTNEISINNETNGNYKVDNTISLESSGSFC